MKKYKIILGIIFLFVLVVGCGKKDIIINNYKNMKIGESINSYSLTLILSGNFDSRKVNQMFIIDNFMNNQYTIDRENNTYYVIDNKTYIKNDLTDILIGKLKNYKAPNHIEIDENIFHDTNLIISGLESIKTKKSIKNDIDKIKLDVYEVTIDEYYIKNLLNALGFNGEYNNAKVKVYLNDKYIYKIIYNIDDLTINASYTKINEIEQLNDFKTE